jgi:methionyl-tRNA formyltransferase
MSALPETRFPENPNIVFMGTPEFSVPSLERLISEGYKVSAVVTQPDRPKGRGRRLAYSPVKIAALKNNIQVLQPERVNAKEFHTRLKEIRPDLFIAIAFGQILDKVLLAIPGFGAFNIHASLLPKYRGAAPIRRTILNDDSTTGLTIMHMNEGLDTGPILFQEELPVLDYETYGHLHDRLSLRSGDLIVRYLKDVAGGIIKGHPQDDSLATYAPKIDKNCTILNWSEEATKISCLIRALDPRPGACTLLNGKKMKLYSSKVYNHKYPSNCPGRIQIDSNGLFLVETGRGIIEIGEVQSPGKKRISARDFLHGHSTPNGTVLGK